MAVPPPLLPDYRGACIANVVPALAAGGPPPPWLPAPARQARQTVLLVLDGLGWDQLQSRRHLAPALAAMEGSAITSVAPTTTATALTSIVTGTPPGEHGVMGYRMHVGDGQVLNVLRWRTDEGDARTSVPPGDVRSSPPFCGLAVPAVVRAEFLTTGFTAAHLDGARLRGWRQPSTLVTEVAVAVEAAEPFVYAYYDGIDRVAHEHGLGRHYDAELVAADRLVADLLAVLPAGAALVVTSDHGQVHVGSSLVALDRRVLQGVWLLSGEGRFLWLHAEPGATDRVRAAAEQHHGDVAWVRTRAEAVADGWFGPTLTADAEARLGDVAVVPHAPVALVHPDDDREVRLVSRHGSLTPDEMLVPLLAARV